MSISKSSGRSNLGRVGLVACGLALLLAPSRSRAATFVVTNTNNAGAGSLRVAIVNANGNPGPDTIAFRIPAPVPASGVFTILPTTALPTLAPGAGGEGNGTFINGATQTAATGDTNPSGPEVRISGTAAPAGTSGLIITASSCRVHGLIISSFSADGVKISGAAADLNTVDGCQISNQDDGIEISGGAGGTTATGNTIGGTTTASRNLLSGNGGNGVKITGTNTDGNVVLGNYIGVNVAGTAVLSNGGHGVEINLGAGSPGNPNLVGGTSSASRNVISGNKDNGVDISGAGSDANVVQGNYVGLNAAGLAAVSNGGNGVQVNHGAGSLTAPNIIGGTVAGARNVVSGNGDDGIDISDAGSDGNLVQGNYVGLNAAGTTALPNTFDGVEIASGARSNTVGGTAAGARNVISGNNGDGVIISGVDTNGNVVQGNNIGTNPAGTVALGNSDGVAIDAGARSNLIGGTVAGAGNVICGNKDDGVSINDAGTASNQVQGNSIGLNAGGAALGNADDGVLIRGGAQGNLIGGSAVAARNLIGANGDEGIDLNGVGTNGNRLLGNYIGLNAAGAVRANGGNGVAVQAGAQSNLVGGTAAGSRNVISGNTDNGVALAGAGTDNNLVQGNFIGTSVAGAGALPNVRDGVAIETGARSNLVGGTGASARNVISGNSDDGVSLNGAGTNLNVVQGNYIGTNAAGNAALANKDHGVTIEGGAGKNTVGGTVVGARNVISGNVSKGVNIAGVGTDGNQVLANFIGTNAAGSGAIGNDLGVAISENASDNVIGSTTAGNRIAFNRNEGVRVRDDSIGNQIRGNEILSNGGLGINLQPAGEAANTVTPNDPAVSLDADTGPNNLQNFPVITGITESGGTTTIKGSLNSSASAAFDLDFFRSPSADPSGFGEGAVFVGSASVTTNASGNASFALSIAGSFSGEFFTATATNAATGDTSEFSKAVVASLVSD